MLQLIIYNSFQFALAYNISVLPIWEVQWTRKDRVTTPNHVVGVLTLLYLWSYLLGQYLISQKLMLRFLQDRTLLCNCALIVLCLVITVL